MFDPTAFENMRVVLEGMFYDRDLYGEIIIKDRNDYINTAKLSRAYELTFQIRSQMPLVTCKVTLQADLENLAAELMPTKQSNIHAGCALMIEYYFQKEYDSSLVTEINQLVKEIWGVNRTVYLFILSEPLKCNNHVTYKINISFDRIIREDQIDDLTEMTKYVITTLEKLEHVTKM